MEKLPLLADQEDRLNIQRWVEESGLGVEPRLIRAAFRLEGPLNPVALRDALVAVRTRYSALRAGFPGRGAEGYSYINEKVADPLDVIDLPQGSEEEAIALVHARISENGDLDAADVFRARLVRLSPAVSVLGISADHLVVDGQSFEAVQSEIWEIYRAARQQATPTLTAISFTHEDYVRWEASWLTSADAQRLLEKSDALLEGLGANPPALLRHTSNSVNERYTVGTASTSIESDDVAALKRLSRESGKTMFTLMVSSMLTALSAGTGLDTVGTMIPVTRRANREMANTVSYTSSYTSIPARLTEQQTFDELTTQLRLTIVQAIRIGLLPGPIITRRWNPEFLGRLLPRPSAFFDLTSWSWQGDATQVADIRVTPLDLPEVEDGQIESLEVAATVTPDSIRLDAFFPADVYPEPVVDEYLRHWARIASAAARNPSLTVAALKADA